AEDSICDACNIVEEEFLRTYADLRIDRAPVIVVSLTKASDYIDIFDDLSEAEDTSEISVAEELKAYFDEQHEKVVDIVLWSMKKKRTYSRLAQMALDYHSIP
ncbi:hypothetical protein H0H92_009718, partial [Tricholoma furcatifolium]